MPNASGRPRRSLQDSWIVERYQEGVSESVLARELGVGRSSIHRRLVSAGVPLRTAVEGSDLLRHRWVGGLPNSFIDGLLLGDAFIEVNANSNGRLELTQRTAMAPWLKVVAQHLLAAGFDVKVVDRGHRGFQLRTGKYVDFTVERKRWYRPRKRVPQDVALDSVALAHWYMGDGVMEQRGYRVTFCTEAFPGKDVQFLAERLEAIYGWKPTFQQRRSGLRLSLGRRSERRDFVSLVKPHVVSCFNYKLATVEDSWESL